ncbi:MAG: cysteine desulfurase [Chloroflexi bacterium]|nr:cysteine desulfurase [Chloroflexota bacterium]
MDVEKVREDFPILQRRINGKPLIYFDNAATTQRPIQVLNTIQTFYTLFNANVHRSSHTLGREATELYEQAHENVARFIGAEDEREIVFVRNSTEAINLVAYSLLFGESEGLRLEPGDEVVLTIMEHHSNLVPWQFLRDRGGVVLRFVGLNDDGRLDLEQLQRQVTEKTKLVCCSHVSNVLGVINAVSEIGRIAHEAGALFLVDGAQSVPHMPIDVKELGCDFLAFSGHKMLAPMGIGVLYGRRELLEKMTPFLYGGDMITDVKLEGATWNKLPWKFEAGTANVCGGIALGGAVELKSGQRLEGAVDYLQRIGMEEVRAHERELTEYALAGLRAIPSVRIYGPWNSDERVGVIAFNVIKRGELIDPHIVAGFLNDEGIAVRSGGHCAYPLADRLGVAGTVRISFYIYNTKDEVDRFVEVLGDIVRRRLF